MGLIISLILNLVAPGLIEPACTALLAFLPDSGCTCEATFGGILDVTGVLDAQCNLSIPDVATPCVLNLSGEASAFEFLFDGFGSLSVAAENCNIGAGTANFEASGMFSPDMVSIDSCSASGTIQGASLACTCETPGCNSGNELSAVIDCDQTVDGTTTDVIDQCIDFSDFVEELSDGP